MDDVDMCATENASYFDRDGNGCIDEVIGSRHVEYWAEGETVIYYIETEGAPNISDGSDFAALLDVNNVCPMAPRRGSSGSGRQVCPERFVIKAKAMDPYTSMDET